MVATQQQSRAWAWVQHLHQGGTTAWSAFDAAPVDRLPGFQLLPGAQHLELLRRINLAAPSYPAPRDHPRPWDLGQGTVADLVLDATLPGRGRPDLELAGAAPRRDFGWAPVDPSTLSDDELLRVAASAIVDLREVIPAGLPMTVLRQFEPATPDERQFAVWADEVLTRTAQPWTAWVARQRAHGRAPGAEPAVPVPALSPEAFELVRRVRPLMGAVDPEEREAYVHGRLLPWLAGAVGEHTVLDLAIGFLITGGVR